MQPRAPCRGRRTSLSPQSLACRAWSHGLSRSQGPKSSAAPLFHGARDCHRFGTRPLGDKLVTIVRGFRWAPVAALVENVNQNGPSSLWCKSVVVPWRGHFDSLVAPIDHQADQERRLLTGPLSARWPPDLHVSSMTMPTPSMIAISATLKIPVRSGPIPTFMKSMTVP